MAGNNNEKQLKRCLEDTIKAIQEMNAKLQQSDITHSDILSIDLASDNSMNRFTLNTE